MGRFTRVVAVDVPHHVTQRGNGRRFVLDGDADRTIYLKLLRENIALYGVAQGRRKRGWPSFANARTPAGLWAVGNLFRIWRRQRSAGIALQKRGPREKIATDRRQGELTFDP
jgi:hypothetical protein